MKITVNHCLKFNLQKVQEQILTGQVILPLHGNRYRLFLLPMVWKVQAFPIICLQDGYTMNIKKKKQLMVKAIRGFWLPLLLMNLRIIQ